MGGLKCQACRRFVLRRSHLLFLLAAAVIFVIFLLELIAGLSPPPLKSH